MCAQAGLPCDDHYVQHTLATSALIVHSGKAGPAWLPLLR